MSTEDIPFHAHLDRCERCRRRPFDLCAEGTALFEKFAEALEEQLKNASSTPACDGPGLLGWRG